MHEGPVSHATRICNVNACIPARGRAKVRVCISRKDAGEPVPRETEKCCISWVRATYAHIYRRVHKLSSHYRSPRNTLYPCKIVKTNAVPTTKMLRRRLYTPGPRDLDTVVRGFYTYGGSLMKRGQLCQPGADYLVEGPRRRCPFAAVGCRRFRSSPVINSARRLHSFSTSVGRARVNSVWAKWRLPRRESECVSSFYGITVIFSDEITHLKTTCWNFEI